MIKMVLIALFLYVAWSYYSSTHRVPIAQQALATFNAVTKDDAPQPEFKCDGRVYCSQMNSLAEAKYFAKHCPKTKMDIDYDGVPCENDARF